MEKNVLIKQRFLFNEEKQKKGEKFTFSVSNLIYLAFTFLSHICLTIKTNKFQLQSENSWKF